MKELFRNWIRLFQPKSPQSKWCVLCPEDNELLSALNFSDSGYKVYFFFNLQFKRKYDVQLFQNFYLLFCSNWINRFLNLTLFKLNVHFSKCPVCIFAAMYKYTLKVKVLVVQSCPATCNHMDYIPPGSSVHWILQARTLEWVAIPFSKRSSWREGRTWSPALKRILYHWATIDDQWM